jgi:hypothetical protein
LGWRKNCSAGIFSHKDSYVKHLLKQGNEAELTSESITFSSPLKLIENRDKLLAVDREINEIENRLNQLQLINEIENDEMKSYQLTREIGKFMELGFKFSKFSSSSSVSSVETLQKAALEKLKTSKNFLEKLYDKTSQLETDSQEVLRYLQAKKMVCICNYSTNENEDEDEVLLCQFNNIDITKAESFLEKVSQRIFLSAPTTQVFLFLSEESKKLLFREQGTKENDYYSNLKDAESKLLGFFTYDFLAVDLLIESFKAARDRDFRKAIETGGEYGNNYKELIQDLNSILVNKQINPNSELSGVNFQLDKDEDNIELQPEDLSHGELKRLSIYMWIKYGSIENSIVLMDEVEIALHPDWQYQIISDLKHWAPSNQYILATHSYELCQALTPSHVKELEPRLLKQEVK